MITSNTDLYSIDGVDGLDPWSGGGAVDPWD